MSVGLWIALATARAALAAPHRVIVGAVQLLVPAAIFAATTALSITLIGILGAPA